MVSLHTSAALLALTLARAPLPARADSAVPAPMQGVDIVQHLGARLPSSLRFTDSTGRSVTLGSLLELNRPVVLTLVYFKCPMLCSLLLSGLTRAMAGMSLRLGRDYQAITVSFDPSDRPADAALRQHGYLQALDQPDAGTSWAFLTGQEAAIGPLTEAVGFHYRYDPRTLMYAHPAVVTILTPDGRISSYLYELNVTPRQLELALVDASAGAIGSSVDRVLLTCFHYDPAARKYGPYIFGFLRLGGALVLAALALTLGGLTLADRRRRRTP